MIGIALGIAGALGNVITGLGAGKKQRAAQRQQRGFDRQLAAAERNRQAIIDPYSGIKDLSSMISNPFANLQVATKAAEMQATEQDISLAATLDTLRATGAGAGGATALAQAALQSKQGVAASIEQQEAQNEKLRAQGEQNLINAKMAEQQRIQSVAISEGQRVQAAEAAGQQFMFGAQEARTNMDLDRAAAQISQAQATEASANQAQAAAWSNAFTAAGANTMSAFSATDGFGLFGD